MGVVGFFEVVIERSLPAKAVAPDLSKRSEMKRVCITEQEDPISLAKLLEQPDPLGRKIEEQGIPAVDDRLLGDLGKAAKPADRPDEFLIADLADLVV